MAVFFRYPRKLPPLSAFNLKAYRVDFSLDRLAPGVDNIRHDVYLSPTFVNTTRKIVTQLITRYAGVDKKATEQPRHVTWAKEVDGYQQLYLELMRDALNRAKGRNEVQIRYLAQAAVLKMLLEEIKTQYDHLVGRLKKAVRRSELTLHDDLAESPKLKGKLQETLQAGEEMRKKVGLEICGYWREIEEKKTVYHARSGFRKTLALFQ